MIELLVAMAITTIIITILVSITGLSLDTWNRSRSEIRASRQGKAMIDSMSRDFESMVIRKGNNFEWLYAAMNPTVDGPSGNDSPNAINLIFFSAATDRYDGQIGVAGKDDGGDVSAIGYELIFKDAIDGDATSDDKSFILYRKIVDPKETFADFLGQTSLEGTMGFEGVGSNIVSEESNFICENIYQFSLTFNVSVTIPAASSSASATVISVPVRMTTTTDEIKEFKLSGSGIQSDFSSSLATDDQIAAGRLTSVEVSLTVLTDFGMKQLENRSFTGSKKTEFIAENSYQYSKLIPVPGG